MPELITPAFNDTQLFGVGQDTNTLQKMIMEKWTRHYPPCEYYPIDARITEVGQETEVISGEVGSSNFDPLWGEAVDPLMQPQGWQQPHLSAEVTTDVINDPPKNAADPEVRAGPYTLNIRVQRYAHENMLKKLGFDRVRTLLCTIPKIMCDRFDISPAPGDRFRWNDEWYEVQQTTPFGWYNQTTLHLYWVLNVQSAHRGS